MAEYKNIGRPLRVKCACKTIFRIRLHFPPQQHIPAQTSCSITNLSRGSGKCEATITNMSSSGVELRIKTVHKITKGDRIRIEYQEGNSRRMVMKKVIVRKVKGKQITGFFAR